MSNVVRFEVFVECGMEFLTDVIEVDRAEWDAMTPEQQDNFRTECAVDFQNNEAPCGSRMLDEEPGK